METHLREISSRQDRSSFFKIIEYDNHDGDFDDYFHPGYIGEIESLDYEDFTCDKEFINDLDDDDFVVEEDLDNDLVDFNGEWEFEINRMETRFNGNTYF